MSLRHLIKALIAGAAALASVSASAQVKQSGTVTPQHVPYWVTSGVIADGGTSADSPISSLGVTNNGGNGICVNSARVTAPGWQSLCLGTSTNGPGIISLQNYGTASAQSLEFLVNGVPLFPATIPLATDQQIYVGTGVAGVAGIVNLGTNLSISGGVLNASGGGGGGGTLPVASTSQLYGGSGTANLANVVNVGSGLSLSAGTLTATGGGGGGTGSAFKQDFYAGTSFTPGTTTSLTLSTAPTSASAVWVWFDGVYQSSYTWSLAGAVVTFNAAIPSNTQVVEITAGVASGTFSPGGSTTNVQFNSAGTFAGNNGFTYDGTSKVGLGVAGTSTGTLAFSNGTSGTLTLTPPTTGSLGTNVLTLPAVTGTVLTSAAAVTVAQGGTGDTTLTAYAPLFGGTTSTNPIQSGTLGSAGQVLTSNGAGALPTFQASGGAGTIYTNAVSVCGADPTGATDSTSVINTCIATYHAVAFPIGTYQACNIQLTTSNIAIVGTGTQLSSNIGAGLPGGTVFTCNTTTGNVFTINATGSFSIFMQGFSCTKLNGVTPTAGACIGYTGAPICSNCILRDIFAQNQYNGFNLPPSTYGWLDNLWAFQNFNNGFFISASGANGISWSGTGMFAILNNGYGFELANTSAGFVAIGQWSNIGTFANGLGGLYVHASGSGNTINDLFIFNGSFSSDNNDCVQFNTNGGGGLQIVGGLVEECGQGVGGSGSGGVGRGQSISPSHTGNGINFAGTNTYGMVSNMTIVAASTNGVGASAGLGRVTISGNLFYQNNKANVATNGITIGGTSTYATVTGNMGIDAGTQAYGLYSNSGTSFVTATGNVFAGVTAGCGGVTIVKSGNIGTGC